MKNTIIKSIICIACLVSGMAVEAQSTNQKDAPVLKIESIRVPGGHIKRIESKGIAGRGWNLGILPTDWKGELVISNTGNKTLCLAKPITTNVRILSYPQQIAPGKQDTVRFCGEQDRYGEIHAKIHIVSNSNQFGDRRLIYTVVDPKDCASYEKDGKWGCVDLGYHVVVPFEYDEIRKTYYNPSENPSMESVVIEAKKEGKWGIVDGNNRVVIPFEYDAFGTFLKNESEGRLYAKKNGKWGMIDKINNVILPFEYDEFRGIEDGMIRAIKAGKMGFVGCNNQVIVPFEYDEIDFFGSDGKTRARKEGKWGLIDKNNKVIIPFEYESLYFSDNIDLWDIEMGRAEKRNQDGKKRWGIIDRNNHVLIPFEYVDLGYIGKKDGLITAAIGTSYYDEKWGIIDRKNKVIVPFEYKHLQRIWENGKFLVHQDRKFGVIDKNNRILIPIEYDDKGSSPEERLFEVEKDGKRGLFDYRDLKLIIPCEYDQIYTYRNISNYYYFEDGMAKVKKNGKWGMVDRKNKVIVPFKYDHIAEVHK